jgi:glycosyltransferase involved in cell wall biosynthesis
LTDVPAASVLLPCRDAERYLPACIDSLAAQTLQAIEIVAVDDGSRDGTAGLLRAWADRDRRVRLVDAPKRGLVPALRAAAAAARAPLLARMDADDVALPGRLEAQRAFLDATPGVAACGTGVSLFSRTGIGQGYRRYERWLNGLRTPDDVERDLLVECPLAHPALMIRADAYDRIGGYRDRGWPEDYELLLHLHAAGLRAANLPEILLRWRVHPDRLSRRSERYAPPAFRRCKVHWLVAAFLPPDRPVVVWGAGRVGKPLARELLRQGVEVAAFVDLDSRKIGQEIHGAPVLAPDGIETVREAYVLAAVGSPGARGEIRAELERRGRREIRDFRVCA